MKQIIAVTGGIGAGKSTVLDILDRLGESTFDCDRFVHQLYTPGSLLSDRMVGRWGSGIVDSAGRIRRDRVGEIVFSSQAEMEWLNGLVHPEVWKGIVLQAEQPGERLFCGIPLFFEVGWDGRVAVTWGVWCDRDTQRRRLLARGWSEEQISQRLQHQMSMDDKLRKADFGLINSGTVRVLEMQTERLLQRLLRGISS